MCVFFTVNHNTHKTHTHTDVYNMNALKAAESGRIPGDIHVFFFSSSSRAAVRFFKLLFNFILKVVIFFIGFFFFFQLFPLSVFFFHLLHFPYFLFQVLLFPFLLRPGKKSGKHETKNVFFFKCSTNTPVVRSGHNNSSAPGG